MSDQTRPGDDDMDDDDDDDVTIAGDDEVIAALRGPPADDELDDDDLTIDADHDLIAEIRAATADRTLPPPPSSSGSRPLTPPGPPPGPPAPTPTAAMPATAGRWAPQGRLPVSQRPARPDAAPPSRRRPWLLVAGALVLLAAVIGVVVLLSGGDGDDDPRDVVHDLAPDDSGHHPTGPVMLELDDDDTIPTGNSEILAELTATLAAVPLVAVEWAAATTPGVRRGVNEDAWGQDRGTFAIADGMGGRGGGAMAARLAIERFFARLRAADDHPDWRAIAHAVNADVVGAGEREGLHRVGTTLLAAVVAGPVVTLVHLGDSRAYRLTRHPSAPAGAPLRLDVLTHDHTVRAELLAAGLDVGEYRQRGVALHGLTSFIGLDQASLRVDVLAVPVRAGDRILLCTDGVHRQLDDEQLREALAAAECRDTARQLVSLADRVGGRDNATALVLDIGTGPGSGR